MSLLLDALKQAALEKKRQDGLAADQALSDDQLAPNTPVVSREPQPSESQNKDVLGVEGIELSLDEVTPVEINADDQEIIEAQDSADVESDEVHEKPAENAKQQKATDFSFGPKDFNYGHVELFEKDDFIAANTKGPMSPVPIEPSTIEQASTEPAPKNKQAQDVSLADINESSVQHLLEQQQESSVVQLIEESNKVHNTNRYRFYMVYAVLSFLVALALAYQFFTLPSLEKTNNDNSGGLAPKAVASDVIEAVVKNSIIKRKTVDIPLSIQTTDEINAVKEIALKKEKVEPGNSLAIAGSTLVNSANANSATGESAKLASATKSELSSIENQLNNNKPEIAEPVTLANKEEEREPIANSVNEKPPVKGILVQRQSTASLRQRLAEAYQSYQAGDLLLAEKTYQQILKQSPIQKDALLGLAAISARGAKPQKALEYYQKVLNVDPNNYHAKAGLLSLQASAIENPQWLAELDELIFRQPDSAHLHFLKANVFAVRNQWQAAQQSYFNAWEKQPANPDYAFNLAVSLDQLQQTTQALSFYQKAYSLLQNAPHNIDISILQNRIEQLKQGGSDALR